jgi:hypothetical protein
MTQGEITSKAILMIEWWDNLLSHFIKNGDARLAEYSLKHAVMWSKLL